MAIAWPYAAVYTDPAFAASILQAAASSLHYPPPPPVYPTHYPRYSPWGQSFGLPPTTLPLSNPALNLNQNLSLGHSIPQPISQAQLSQTLNIGLDFPHYQSKFDTAKVSPATSPSSEISLSPPTPEGLLIPAKSPQTQVPEAPKLFKPYTEV